MTDTTQDPHAQLWALIKDIRFTMFTTQHSSNGHLHSRPITTQNKSLEADGSLWFFMSRSGDPVADLTANPGVNLAYADPGSDRYVSVSGTAAVVDDPARKQALWSKLVEAWFPKGVNDPDLALVRVAITHADYWDVKETKVVQLFKQAKAAVSGEPPKLGEHARVDFR
jgi:general stress protein 26